jgi:Fusaric acid resistance protein-like
VRNSTLNRLKGDIAARCGKLVGYLPLPQPQVLRHATRMTIAAILAFAAAWAFALPEGYWAVISAVVVMQSSLGGTLGAGLDRLTATVAGAMVGAARIPAWACALARGRGDDADRLPNGSAALRPSFRLAPITAVIVLVGAPPEPGC